MVSRKAESEARVVAWGEDGIRKLEIGLHIFAQVMTKDRRSVHLLDHGTRI